MKHAVLFAALSVITLLAFAAPASATHGDGLQCGDTIETSGTVVAQADIVCPNNFIGPQPAISITANNVTLRLNGYRIQGGWAGGCTMFEGCATAIRGGVPSAPLSGIHIRQGIVAAADPANGFLFARGVLLYANDSSVRGMQITSCCGGIDVIGDRNEAHANTVENTSSARQETGVRIIGDDAHITRSTVTGRFVVGVHALGDRPRVAVNTVQCTSSGGTGVWVDGYTGTAVIGRDNVVTGCALGITVTAGDTGTPQALVRRNTTNGGGGGLRVEDPAAFVWRNTANGNDRDGIEIGLAGATLAENTANSNANYGINAVEGTIDGGGNTATGNDGDGLGLNCTPNIQC